MSLGVCPLPGGGVALADGAASWTAAAPPLEQRLVWWRAPVAGLRAAACWDLAVTSRLLHGPGRDDPAAVWALAAGLPVPAPEEPAGTLLAPPRAPGPVAPDGQLAAGWAQAADRQGALALASLALVAQQRQQAALAALPDPRRAPAGPALAVQTARAESAAALLALELQADGLPLDRAAATALLEPLLGPRPASPDQAQQQRQARDAAVLAAFAAPGPVDLRSPAAVLALLHGAGFDVPDTRSFRLEPHRATSRAVDALLRWRKAERLDTTYGWAWLDRCVGPDGRLRGTWSAADAAAGRMTAGNGLHNLPAELRPAVAADPGWALVRADLGQVEPRVLAVVSGDQALARAAASPDLYAPVAAAMGCDRPTAKVAVLAAMYGATGGTAGAALARMEQAYPVALAHLRAAEAVGRQGGSLRTWGGRLLQFGSGGHGRYARNAVVQGAAAELFKAWAAAVRAGLLASQGRIVLCLHDELLLHVPVAAVPDAVALLRDALAGTQARWAAGSGVQLVVQTGVGRTWAQAK